MNRPYKITKAETMEQGHSAGEQILYMTLWAQGTGNPDGSRDTEGGLRTLAKVTNSSDKAVKRNLASLEEKLAIKMLRKEDSATRQAKIFRIYPPEKVYQNRLKAGMIWIRRDKGVSFVDNNSTEECHTSVVSSTTQNLPNIPQ